MFKCDFCHKETSTLKRVVLDKGYNRLKPKDTVLYACPDCSENKDNERLGYNGLTQRNKSGF